TTCCTGNSITDAPPTSGKGRCATSAAGGAAACEHAAASTIAHTAMPPLTRISTRRIYSKATPLLLHSRSQSRSHTRTRKHSHSHSPLPSPSPMSQRVSAIHGQHRPRNVARTLGAEKDDDVRDILWIAQSPEHRALARAIENFRRHARG